MKAPTMPHVPPPAQAQVTLLCTYSIELPPPDSATDWHRGGEGDPAYSPTTVMELVSSAFEAGKRVGRDEAR